MLAQIIRRVPRGRLRHQQRPRRADDKRRVHRRRFRAPREDRGAAHASSHAPGVKPRRHQDLPLKKPPGPSPLRPSRERHDDAHHFRGPAFAPAADQRRHAGHNTSRAIRREPTEPQRGPREQRHDFTGRRLPRSSARPCPAPSTGHSRALNMQPTAQMIHRRPRWDTKMGLAPQEPPLNQGIEDQRGSSFRPTWRTIKEDE